MRNLKKILSLALALVMVMSLLTVASAREFNDAADIEHTEAVEVMSSLGVINGMGGNMFNPKGNVTRAEMAKMITYICLGNVEPTAFLGTNTNLTDIGGHWAEAYIKYCYSQGIISGRGNGIFDPNANVTATEAARMLLVAIGYNADVQVYTGASWAINVVRDATISGFYDDVTVTSNEVLSRDKAAQMMYNALNADIIEKTSIIDRTDGSISDQYSPKKDYSLLNKSFEAQIWMGTFDGTWNTGDCANKGEIQVTGALEADYAEALAGQNGKSTTGADFPADFNIDYIGEEVKVIFKDGRTGTKGQPDKNDTIYGVYLTGGTDVVRAAKSDVKDDYADKENKIKVSGTIYDAEATVPVNTNMTGAVGKTSALNGPGGSKTASDLTLALKGDNGDQIKLILKDGKIQSAYITESKIGYVTAVTSEKISTSVTATMNIADNDVYDGAALNDIVVCTTYYDTFSNADEEKAYTVVRLADAVTGTVTGFKNTEDVSVDGTTYKIYDKKSSMSENIGDKTSISSFSSTDIGDEYTLYLVNGYVGYAIKVEGSVNYAIVTDANDGYLDSTFNAARAQLLLPTGEKVNVTLHKDSIIKSGASLGTSGSNIGTNTAVDTVLPAGQLVEYTVMSDGVYKITEVGSYTNATYQVYDKDTKSFDNKVTKGDCPLFVAQADGAGVEYKAYSIRDLDDITPQNVAGFNSNTACYGYYVKDGRVVAAFVTQTGRPSGASANMFYGVVSAENGTTKVDGSTYESWTVANHEGSQTVLVSDSANWALWEKGSASLKLAKGDLVGFALTNDNVYKTSDIELYTGDSLNLKGSGLAVWAKEYVSADNTLTYWGSLTRAGSPAVYTGTVGSEQTVALDDDCKIIYVDRDGKKGGSNIGMPSFDRTTGYENMLIIQKEDGLNKKIEVIFVETSRDVNILGVKGQMTQTGALTWNTATQGSGSVVNNAITVTGVPHNQPNTTITLNKSATQTVTISNVRGGTATEQVGTTTTAVYQVAGTAGSTVTFTLTVTEAGKAPRTYTASVTWGAAPKTADAGTKDALTEALGKTGDDKLDEITVSSAITDLATPITIDAGQTLNVNENLTSSSTITVKGSVVIAGTKTLDASKLIIDGGSVTATGNIANTVEVEVKNEATVDLTGKAVKALTVTNGTAKVGNITNNLVVNNTAAPAAQAGEPIFDVETGTVGGTVAVTAANVKTGNVTGAVTVNSGSLEAGTMGAKLDVKAGASAKVASVHGFTSSDVANAGTITVTGAVTAPSGADTTIAGGTWNFEAAFETDDTNATVIAASTQVNFNGNVTIAAADMLKSTDGTSKMSVKTGVTATLAAGDAIFVERETDPDTDTAMTGSIAGMSFTGTATGNKWLKDATATN